MEKPLVWAVPFVLCFHNQYKMSILRFSDLGSPSGVHGSARQCKGVPERVSKACSTAHLAKTARNTFAEISGGYENRKEPQDIFLRLRLDTRRGI